MSTSEVSALPGHIAIIMDGNNRWARSKGLPTKKGHRYGAEAAREIVYACVEQRIPYLTLFAFSNENWLRPTVEVQSLMALFVMVLKRHEIRQLHSNNVRIMFAGKRSGFSPRLLRSMQEAEALTDGNSGTRLIVAADYGGRWDITEAARSLARKVESGKLTSHEIDDSILRQHTSLGEIPDPDLCIRTGGEHRISNFLLWNFAYTELYFTDCFWPDFNKFHLQMALDDYASRQRRFGSHDKPAEPVMNNSKDRCFD
ncbi:MAG: polyprenyl diphosphate synthase [Gammaproteobacteria bacterium]|nr:polyprenyl diphosphate synthase [Gammaproteobacteria bacterium]MCY4357639.1 polyprenyl diphosphate synthase [Gammaproteobacteria bacterium]